MTTTITTLKTLARKVRLTFEWGAQLGWDKQDDWQRKANGYRCTLHYHRRQHTFDFWQGIGITTNPTAEGCLSCLLLDAQSGEYDFEEFCKELGYDTDSRKAEAIWRSCQKTRANLERLLGDDFEQFLYAEQD